MLGGVSLGARAAAPHLELNVAGIAAQVKVTARLTSAAISTVGQRSARALCLFADAVDETRSC